MAVAEIVVLGVRHHGPGSARAVERALELVRPAAVVIEGAPELDAVLPLAADARMVPPVAGLVYDVARPRQAAFYPLASFSPEWVALRWALDTQTPVSCADLPAAHRFAIEEQRTQHQPPIELEPEARGSDGAEPEDESPAPAVVDPLGTLAALAGYDDAERWWEDAIEQRSPDDPLAQFSAVNAAMAEYREHSAEVSPPPGDLTTEREAAMRRALRKLSKEVDGTIVVVCGAFHAPALQPAEWPTAAHDNAVLKGLPKTKVAATWAPWTSRRLAHASGYGAGVSAPRWYEHLFAERSDVISSWMVRTAGLLRAERFDASPASVVEATRLADALAALRGRPLAGVSEVLDASTTVLGQGYSDGLSTIAEALWVGRDLGTVPEATPMVPLAEDLARTQKSLRLKPSAEQKVITLDLRTESHRNRSTLLRRLALLDIPWGVEQAAGRTTGTFKEAWVLEWQPDFAVALIEASVHGTTVETAATSRSLSLAAEADSLSKVAGLVETCLLAGLFDGVDQILTLLESRAAEQSDHLAVMQTVAPLARTVRYGSVRAFDTETLRAVLDTFVRRSAVGLAAASTGLDDAAALDVRRAIESIDQSVVLIDDALAATWRAAMAGLSETAVHGVVMGRVSRLLLDAGAINSDEASARLSRALSIANDPADAAAWLDGFIAGDIALLLHDEQIFSMIDDWLTGLAGETFDDLLPLVRRSFSAFETGERRQLADLVVRGAGGRSTAEREVDVELAAPVVERVAALLGLEVPT